jgi:hypothetical protein
LRFYASSLTSDIDVAVKECVFSDNNGLQGSAAGLSLDGNNGKVNVTITNSLFLRQTSNNYSVFYINDGSNSTGMTVKFINNTFTNNTSGNAYNTLGVLNGVQATTSFVFSNNIMWGNNYDQAYNNIQMVRNSSSNASVTVTNNVIEDGYTGGGTVANNLDADPLFANAADPDGADNVWGTADDGLALQGCSPSVNTGTGTGAPATDIAGVTRPQGAQADRGAYERDAVASVTPSVTIAVTTGVNPTCVGNSITFTATITNGGDNPTYQWTKNGNNILNAIQATYTGVAGTDFANGDLIRCVLISNAVCASPTSVTGSAITVTINTYPSASIVGNNGPVCVGGNAVFTVNGTSNATLTYSLTGQMSPQTLVLNGTNQTILANGISANVTLTLLSVTNEVCPTPLSAMSTITVNESFVVSTPQNTLCTGLGMTLSPTSGGTWQSSNLSIATITNQGIITAISPGSVYFTFTQTATGCSAATNNITIKPTPSSSLTASQTDVCANTEVTLDAHCSIPNATVNWNPGAPTVTPNAATIPYIYKASCTADGCTGNESSIEVRTHRILVDMKDLDVGVLPLPIARSVKDNMTPTNLINAPSFPRRWTFIAHGCNASESAVFKLTGPVNISTIDNDLPYAMFSNEVSNFYSLDHPNYGNGGSFPNGTYTLTVDLRSADGAGGPFPKNRVATGNLLANRILQFTVANTTTRKSAEVVSDFVPALLSNPPLSIAPEHWLSITENPVSKELKMYLTGNVGEETILTLVTLQGYALFQRNVQQTTAQQYEVLDVRNLPLGVYILKAVRSDKVKTFRIIRAE